MTGNMNLPKRRLTSVTTGLIILLAVGACGFPKRESTPLTTYVLEIPATSATTDDPFPLSLVIGTPIAGPGLTTSRMIYVSTPYQVDYFAYHQWTDSPSRMLLPLIRERLEQSGLFLSVVTAPAPARTDWRLDSELVRLRQVFSDGAGSELQVVMHVRLVDLSAPAVLATKTFSIDEPCSEDTPYGGVLAANRAVDRLLTELVDFVAGVAREGAPH